MIFPLALYYHTLAFSATAASQYYCSALPGILYDLSGSHLDMAQGIIFSDLPGCHSRLKSLAHYRFRDRHHLLPE